MITKDFSFKSTFNQGIGYWQFSRIRETTGVGPHVDIFSRNDKISVGDGRKVRRTLRNFIIFEDSSARWSNSWIDRMKRRTWRNRDLKGLNVLNIFICFNERNIISYLLPFSRATGNNFDRFFRSFDAIRINFYFNALVFRSKRFSFCWLSVIWTWNVEIACRKTFKFSVNKRSVKWKQLRPTSSCCLLNFIESQNIADEIFK